jgi:hypothetical protein
LVSTLSSSGYPGLEEAYHVAELLFPRLHRFLAIEQINLPAIAGKERARGDHAYAVRPLLDIMCSISRSGSRVQNLSLDRIALVSIDRST